MNKTPQEWAKFRAANGRKPVQAAYAQDGSIRWSLNQFNRATGPLVYVWWGKDGDGSRRAIYVGKSIHGLTRPLDPKHHRKDARNYLTDVEFICCATEADALAMEAKLIRKLDPIDNRQRPGPAGKYDKPYRPRMYR